MATVTKYLSSISRKLDVLLTTRQFLQIFVMAEMTANSCTLSDLQNYCIFSIVLGQDTSCDIITTCITTHTVCIVTASSASQILKNNHTNHIKLHEILKGLTGHRHIVDMTNKKSRMNAQTETQMHWLIYKKQKPEMIIQGNTRSE